MERRTRPTEGMCLNGPLRQHWAEEEADSLDAAAVVVVGRAVVRRNSRRSRGTKLMNPVPTIATTKRAIGSAEGDYRCLMPGSKTLMRLRMGDDDVDVRRGLWWVVG